ncbi:MAG: helix-turn-helix domain-containing protein [Vulcanimicrobiaceae bacterium]
MRSFAAKIVSSTIAGVEEGALLHILMDEIPRMSCAPGQFLPRESIPFIKRVVASAFGTTMKKINRPHRAKIASVARDVAIYLSCDLTQTSLPQIARHFGKRDHTSIVHVRDRVKSAMRHNEFFRNKVVALVDVVKLQVGDSNAD